MKQKDIVIESCYHFNFSCLSRLILITGGAYNRWRPLVSWTMATLGSPEPSDADTGNTTTEICFNPHTKWKCRLTFNSEIIEVSDFCWAWNTCTERVQNAGGRVWNSCFIAVYRFVIFFTFSNIWIFVFCEAFFLEGGGVFSAPAFE